MTGHDGGGRIFEGENPNILICPQCGEVLECTDHREECYCWQCDVVWMRREVTSMIQYGEDEPIPYELRMS